MPNALEVDFLPVGNNSKSGDAIAMRFGDYESGVWKNQKVIVTDGGNADSGQALVKHIQEVYKTDTVDWGILTHPDGDHASGLRTVIDELNVDKIWMHRPWNHSADLIHLIQDGRITKSSFEDQLRNTYQFAYEIEQIAKRKKIDIIAPHQGNFLHLEGERILTVLGPSKEFYLSLIRDSDKTPDMEIQESAARGFATVAKTTEYEDMTLDTEHLGDNDEGTTCENNMSLILYLTVASRKILFTADAGVKALYEAIEYAHSQGIDLRGLDRFQVPHHGSRRNITQGILEQIHASAAFISCSKEGEPSHPSKIVTNALWRREIKVYETQGSLLTHHTSNVPSRPGMVNAIQIPFYNYVEIPRD